jgi:tetratricopeptide (TPR) repeat protein
MGEITFLLGDWNGATSYLERARTIVRSLGSSWFAPYPPLHLGRIAIARGEYEAASEHIEEALSIAHDVDNYQCVVLGQCYLAEIDLLQGRTGSAIGRLGEVLRPEDMEKEDSTLTTPLFYSAWAYLEAGDLAEAAARAGLAVKWLMQEQSVIELLIARRIEGMVAAAQGNFERAGTALEESIELARKSRYVHGEACALYEYGMMCLRQGRRDQALPRLGEALRIFQNLGAQPYIERVGRAVIQGAA